MPNRSPRTPYMTALQELSPREVMEVYSDTLNGTWPEKLGDPPLDWTAEDYKAFYRLVQNFTQRNIGWKGYERFKMQDARRGLTPLLNRDFDDWWDYHYISAPLNNLCMKMQLVLEALNKQSDTFCCSGTDHRKKKVPPMTAALLFFLGLALGIGLALCFQRLFPAL